MNPNDTQPCPASIPPGEDAVAREERAKAAYAAYSESLSLKGFTEEKWEELEGFEREGWRCAADVAYRHVIVVASTHEPLPPSSPPTSRNP